MDEYDDDECSVCASTGQCSSECDYLKGHANITELKPKGFSVDLSTGEIVSGATIKSYKCKKCQVHVAPQVLSKTVAACPHNHRTDHMACGLKQMATMIERLNDKKDGKPKVYLLSKKATKEEPVVVNNEYELEIPDPIRILIDKKGQVTQLGE